MLVMTLLLVATLGAEERVEVFLPAPVDASELETRLRADPATSGLAVRVHQRADAAALALAEPGAVALVPGFFAAALPG